LNHIFFVDIKIKRASCQRNS